MQTVKGKYNEAKVFTEAVEGEALKQIKSMCDSEIFKGSLIRIMPDVHAGASCTIGTTMTVKDKIAPNMVGTDITMRITPIYNFKASEEFSFGKRGR